MKCLVCRYEFSEGGIPMCDSCLSALAQIWNQTRVAVNCATCGLKAVKPKAMEKLFPGLLAGVGKGCWLLLTYAGDNCHVCDPELDRRKVIVSRVRQNGGA